MTVTDIMAELEARGDEKIKTLLLKHGVKEPFFGVKVEYLKSIQKKIKRDYQLAKDLYATGNADAQYLAGLIADDKQMTKADLQTWAEQALSNNISEYTVPWVTAESNYGYEMAIAWINADQQHIAAAGWSTLANTVSLKPDSELPIVELRQLIDRVIKTIHDAPNRVKYTMNGFVIALGCYVNELIDEAKAASAAIGPVTIDMNGTACKVPNIADNILKLAARGSLGKKKKTVKC
jgi:3-methyladenine DNA glycosylase AlkD